MTTWQSGWWRCCSMLGLVTLGAGCPSQPAEPHPMLVADPPTDDGTPGAGLADFDRGVAFIQNEAYVEAIPHFDKALAAQPGNAQAVYYRALAHERIEKLAEAEAGYAKALELDPKLVDAAVNLAALYLDDKPGAGPGPRPQKAIDVLTAILPHAPEEDVADLRTNLGYAYRLTRNWDKATDQYRAVLAKKEDPGLRFALGDMLFEADRCGDAATELRKAIAGHREDLRVLVTIGDELGRCKDYEGCVQALDAAVALRAKEPDWPVRRGVCWHGAGKEDKARADFELALKLAPGFAPAHYYLGVSYRDEKQRLKAIAALEKAQKLDPEGPIGKKAKEALDALAKDRK